MSHCRFAGLLTPRLLKTHLDNCNTQGCPGCEPCPQPHCHTCNRTHLDNTHPHTCPTCVGDTRQDLQAIRHHYETGDLENEATHQGINSTATNLAGPTADTEQWNHVEASILAGRVPDDWQERDLDRDGNEKKQLHPLTVLGWWDMLITEHLDHDRQGRITVTTAAAYIERNLTALAQDPLIEFAQMAADLARCRTHLEAVLHDSNRGIRANVPCFDCGADLERKLGIAGFDDVWTCKGCRRRYTIAEFNFALRAELEKAQTE